MSTVNAILIWCAIAAILSGFTIWIELGRRRREIEHHKARLAVLAELKDEASRIAQGRNEA